MSARKGDNDQIVQGSGNVFADLGIELSPDDELKLVLAREIARVITARRHTQVEVARLLGTSQARVSEITRGRLDNFSAERLLRYLLALGISLDVYPSVPSEDDRPASPGRVHFHAPMAACG